MSQTEVIVDEQALDSVSEGIKLYSERYRETFEDAINKLKSNKDDWNDEDFDILLSAISFFVVDIEAIENETNKLSVRIDNKIKAIHELHSMKI